MTSNEWEAVYPDGSYAQPGVRAGGMAVNSFALFVAIQALQTYIKWDGKMQTTRNGHRNAVINVIEPMTGEKFSTATGKVTMASCRKALDAAVELLAKIEASRVILLPDEAGPSRAGEDN
jgi:hypothetical protein